MKKILTIVCSLLFVALILFGAVACSSKAAVLRAPDHLKLNSDTLTLSWSKISKARSYAVMIEGEQSEIVLKNNFISLEFLDPGDYEIQVKAVGDGQSVRDSEWVSYTFHRDAESGLRYNLINSGSAYELVGPGTAKGDVVMEDVYRGKPVVSIAAKALYGNSSITGFTVGKNVKTIGKSAFANCAELTTLDFAENAMTTSVGENAFQNSKKLETVKLPDSLVELPKYMFSWCYGLKSVTLGQYVTTINAHAFLNCKALQSIALPDTVTVIGEYAFSECEALQTVTLGKGVREIHDYAFFNCESMEALELADGLVSIGLCAFAGCEKIPSVVIPDSCLTLAAQAFQKCSALGDVVLGDGLTSVGAQVFEGTKIYEEAQGVFCIDGWVIEAKDKELTALELPKGIYGIASMAFYECKSLGNIRLEGIKYINHAAFAYCESIQAAIFDSSLLDIDTYAFYNCKLLRRTALGQSLVRIGAYAFAECKRLDNTSDAIDLPKTLTSIGSSAFKNTLAYDSVSYGVVYIDDWAVEVKDPPAMSVYSNIIFDEGTRGIADYCCDNMYVAVSIEMASSVEYIGKGAFYGVYMAQAILLPANLKYIGDYAFFRCAGAWFGENGHTTIPAGTEYIGRSAFYDCLAMVGLTIPGSVKTVGDYAFSGCINLGDSDLYLDEEQTQKLTGSVIIEEGVESIGSRVFYKCANITEITIPDSVTSMGIRVFYLCSKLNTVTLGSGLSEIPEYTFYKCEALQHVRVPDSVQTIEKYAFRGCTALQNVDFGAGVKTIENFAFYGCTDLLSICLPASVEHVGDFAFRGCTSAQTIVIPGSVRSIGKHAFYGDTAATILCESQYVGQDWNMRWNSSYLPTVFGAQLSEDGTYLISFAVGGLTNISDIKTMAPLAREGYTFLGFAVSFDSTDVAYTIQTMTEAPAETILYTVWEQVAEASTNAR